MERIIYTSSVAAIGVGKPGEIVNETHQSPVNELVGHYKKSKYWAEQEAKKAIINGQDIVIVNPSTPIGPLDIKPYRRDYFTFFTPSNASLCQYRVKYY